jgi:hypothetical protein
MEQAVHAYESFFLCIRGTLDQAQLEKCKINNPDSCIWSLAWKDVVIALLLVLVIVVLMMYFTK